MTIVREELDDYYTGSCFQYSFRRISSVGRTAFASPIFNGMAGKFQHLVLQSVDPMI